VIDLDEDGDEVVNDDFLEGLAVNKDQMEQELDKVLKMMKEIEVSPPPSSKDICINFQIRLCDLMLTNYS